MFIEKKRKRKKEIAADRMATLHSESIELPKNERTLSESFDGAQIALPDLLVPKPVISARETTDLISSNRRSTPLAHSREAPDDFPEGGYGWIVVMACSVIRYAILPRMHLPVYRFLRRCHSCYQAFSSED